MLTLDTTAFHGLSLPELNTLYREPVGQALAWLFDNPLEKGGWRAWTTLPKNQALIEKITACVERYIKNRPGHIDAVVVLGIGGSSLGGYSVLKALLHPYWNDLPAEKRVIAGVQYPRFYFVENVDADQIAALGDVLDFRRTLFNVISKSGNTTETMAALFWVKAQLDALDPALFAQHVIATTDASSGLLRPMVDAWGLESFEVPDDVGGRFSVFSAVGLLPAALCGVDIAALLRGAEAMADHHSMMAQAALMQFKWWEQGKTISVFMPYSARLAPVADWYVQLWGESLGKRVNTQGQVVYAGSTPVKAVGVTDQHSQVQLYNEGPFDKSITFVQLLAPEADLPIPQASCLGALPHAIAQHTTQQLGYLMGKSFHQVMTAEFEATRQSLSENQRPSVTLVLPALTPETLGQLLYFLQVQTALMGHFMGIDPFDQPGVELGKRYTKQFLS